MKMFKKFITKKQKTDPRSQGFVDNVRFLLEKHGVSGTRNINECSLKLVLKSVHFFRKMENGQRPSDNDLKDLIDKMKVDLMKYGVTDTAKQEAVISEYIDILVGMAAE